MRACVCACVCVRACVLAQAVPHGLMLFSGVCCCLPLDSSVSCGFCCFVVWGFVFLWAETHTSTSTPASLPGSLARACMRACVPACYCPVVACVRACVCARACGLAVHVTIRLPPVVGGMSLRILVCRLIHLILSNQVSRLETSAKDL